MAYGVCIDMQWRLRRQKILRTVMKNSIEDASNGVYSIFEVVSPLLYFGCLFVFRVRGILRWLNG